MSVLDPNTIYQSLVEHMNEGIMVADKSSTIIFVNPRLCELLEYSEEELLGKSELDLMDNVTRNKVASIENELREKGVSSKYEGTFVTKSGRNVSVLISGTPLPNGEGTVGIITDLTEFKKERTTHRRLVEHMNEAVWMVDSHGVTTYTNPKFTKLTGFTQQEIIGKNAYEFLHPDTRKKVEEVDKVRKKGRSSSYEGIIQKREGGYIPVLISGTPLPDGGSVAIITDLTKIKEKEKRERSLNRAIEYASDSIIIFDSSGEVQTWNKGAKTVFGYRKEEILGAHVDTLFDKQSVEKMLENSSEVTQHEISGKHKNAHDVKISATLTPIFDDHKEKIAFCLLIGRDITHKMKVDEELALRIDRIKEAYSQMGFMRRQMDYMFELLELANSETDPKKIADFIVRSVFMLSGADAAMLRRLNTDKSQLEMVAHVGVTQQWTGKATLDYEGSLAQQAIERNTSLKIIDVSKEPQYQSLALAKANNLCSMLLIPLQYNFESLGTLSLYMSADKKLEIFEDDFIEKYAHLAELVLGPYYIKD